MSYIRDVCPLATTIISNDLSVAYTDLGGTLAWSNFLYLRLALAAIVPQTDAQGLHLEVSTDGGSTWKTTLYSHSSRGQETDSTLYGTSWTSGSVIRLMRSMGAIANEKGSGTFKIYNAADAASYTVVAGLAHFKHFTGVGRQQHVGGEYQAAVAVNGLRLSMGSGNLVSGIITLEGIRK